MLQLEQMNFKFMNTLPFRRTSIKAYNTSTGFQKGKENRYYFIFSLLTRYPNNDQILAHTMPKSQSCIKISKQVEKYPGNDNSIFQLQTFKLRNWLVALRPHLPNRIIGILSILGARNTSYGLICLTRVLIVPGNGDQHSM